MTDPTRGDAAFSRNGFGLAIAALAGIATMAQQALGDLRAMGFGDLVDASLAQYADPGRDAAITATLETAVALSRRTGEPK